MPSTGRPANGPEPRHEKFDALLAVLDADACVIGLFAEQGVLATRPWVVMHNMRAGDLSEHTIYQALFGSSFPGFHTTYVDQILGNNAFLRGVLIKRAGETAAFEQGVSERLAEALRLAIEPERARGLLRTSAGKIALERRHDDQIALVTVDSGFRVAQRWLSPRAKTHFGEMRLRLPVYLEEPLRLHLRDWNWNDASQCAPVAFSPVPDVVLRAFPLEQDGAVRAMVAIEGVQLRLALDRAREEHHLSPREVEVLRYLFEGYRIEEIAQALSVADSTVQDHIKRAIGKAGVRNRMQLAARILGWDFAAWRS